VTVPLLRPEQHWVCPACDQTDVTHEARPHSRMHSCRGLRGLTVPMVPDGVRAEHRINRREDYAGRQILQRDGDGNVVMSVTTIRDEGQDCSVMAPTAVLNFREMA
jgi:hypothetical protein